MRTTDTAGGSPQWVAPVGRQGLTCALVREMPNDGNGPILNLPRVPGLCRRSRAGGHRVRLGRNRYRHHLGPGI